MKPTKYPAELTLTKADVIRKRRDGRAAIALRVTSSTDTISARPVIVVALATFISIVAGYALSVSVFATASVLTLFAVSVGLSCGAALLAVVAMAVYWTFRITDPGYVLHTVSGVIVGTAAVETIGLLFPGLVVGTIDEVWMFALANTLVIWGMGVATKSFGLTFLPEFDR